MTTYPTYKLGDVAEIILGQSPKSKSYNTKGDGLPFFQGKTEFTDWFPIPNKWCTEPKKIAEPFDVLLSVRAPVGPTNVAKEKCCIGRGLAAIRYTDCYKYVLYYLRSVSKYLESKATGTTFSSISGDTIKNLPIPLPPLPTQHSIVTRIETLFAELDKAAVHLRTAQQQLKTYRQAVLNHWLNNDDGKWEMVKLGEVAEMCLGKMLDKNKNKGAFQPYLRNVNVRWGQFDLDDLLEMKFEESEQDRYGIRKGDLIMCEGGEPGRCAIWDYDIQNMKIQKALHRIRLNDNVLNKYVYFLFVLYAQNGVLDKYFTGTTIKHLTGQSLKSVEFPLPPLSEQQRIVTEIESRLSQAEASSACIENALQQAEALRQSILKKAFSGELV